MNFQYILFVCFIILCSSIECKKQLRSNEEITVRVHEITSRELTENVKEEMMQKRNRRFLSGIIPNPTTMSAGMLGGFKPMASFWGPISMMADIGGYMISSALQPFLAFRPNQSEGSSIPFLG